MPAKAKPTFNPIPTRRNRRRLRTRIVLSFFLLGLALTALFAYATMYAAARVEDQTVGQVLRRNVDEYAQQFYVDHNATMQALSDYRALVYGPDKRANVRPDWAALESGVYVMNGVQDGKPYVYRLVVRKDPDYWFFLAQDLTRARESQERMKWILVAAVGVFSVLSLILGWWSASRVMSPVSDLVGRIRRRSAGNVDPEPLAPHFADDEVGELARAMDDYSTRITEVARRDSEFNADVSHELRTPLAVIRSTVELMLETPDLSPKMLERIQRIQRAQETGTAITETLLMLSRDERGRGNTPVARVVEQLLDAHRLQMRRGKSLDLRMEGNTALVVDAPEASVNVALGNLIANAVKYTDAGGVTVRLNADSVDVIDSGRGLSPQDQAHLLERGYRGTSSGNTAGGGIGLSIVTRICDLYGWRVAIAPRTDAVGTVASLSFAHRP